MNCFKQSILTFFFLFCCLTGAVAQENQTYVIHTISKGQSLYSISNMYGVSIDEIMKLNPGSDRTIYEGAKLRIPRANSESKQTATFHTIQSGETLYRLSVKYNVSVQALCDMNPGLSAENFRAGQVISIPAAGANSAKEGQQVVLPSQPTATPTPAVQPKCRDMHKVARKETVYSIANRYGITEAELYAANPELKNNPKNLKKGKFLCIPYATAKTNNAAETPQNEPTNAELFNKTKREKKAINTVKAALILPFLSAQGSESARMIEYYQGFLMAVDSLKRTGTSVDLYSYDSGTDVASLNAVLAKPELKNMDVIFGPLQTVQIKPLADFAEKNSIRLVIPFTSRDNTVYRNPYVYQINTPQSYLYSEVYEHFTSQFRNANVVIIESIEQKNKKDDFISGLKSKLSKNAIPVKTISEDANFEQLKATIKNGMPNVFVPTSGSDLTLIKVLPQLSAVVKDSTNVAEIHLFGYPEWQTYTDNHLSEFFELDTYFYSSFYTNNLLQAARRFSNNYRRWFGHDMQDRYPKYGMLGFDTGFYFLKGLALYGSDFEQNQQKMNVTPIQTGFRFERVNNWGGFVNKKVFFVRFSKNYELIKMDFD